MFVRAGSILPMGAVVPSTATPQAIERIKVYPGRDADFDLYDDDGVSYDYQRGGGRVTHLHWDDATHRLSASGSGKILRHPAEALLEVVSARCLREPLSIVRIDLARPRDEREQQHTGGPQRAATTAKNRTAAWRSRVCRAAPAPRLPKNSGCEPGGNHGRRDPGRRDAPEETQPDGQDEELACREHEEIRGEPYPAGSRP